MDPLTALTDLGGFASRAMLVSRGVSRQAIAQAHRDGRIVRVHRGIYGRGLPDGTDALRAAVVRLNAVVSHDSAAFLWGLEMISQPRAVLTVPRNRGRAGAAEVTIVRADVDELDVREGLRVTSVLRMVLDCARVLPLAEAVVIADSALRKRLITIEELRSAAAQTRGSKASRLRRVAALADANAASVMGRLRLPGRPPARRGRRVRVSQ